MNDISLTSSTRLFERDVNCVREYFRRRFGYECAGYPVFEELTRDDNMDVEVSCSGFTKQMEKDILQAYGMESDDDASDTESEEEVKVPNQTDESTDYTETELASLRKQVDTEVQFSEQKAAKSSDKNSSILKYIESLSEHLQNSTFDDEVDVFEDAIADDEATRPVTKTESTESTAKTVVSSPLKSILKTATPADDQEDTHSIRSNEPQSDDDELGDLDPTSREYRFKMVEKLLSDARSHRSYSTTASTIAPSVIKDRIRKTIEVKKKDDIRKRCVAKGEASAVTRVRKENRDTCKEYAGWDF